jgi:hypothetical protein
MNCPETRRSRREAGFGYSMLLGGTADDPTTGADDLREARIARLVRSATNAWTAGDRIRARLLVVFMAHEIAWRSEARVKCIEIERGLRWS